MFYERKDMTEFIATFHTHADAILAHRTLSEEDVEARMMPVPRKLSSSCGTCVRYTAEKNFAEELKPADFEAIYTVEGIGKYAVSVKGEEDD